MELNSVIDDKPQNEGERKQRDRSSYRCKNVEETSEWSQQTKIEISIAHLGGKIPEIWGHDSRMDAVHGLEPKNIEKEVLTVPRADVRDMQKEKVGCVVEGYERG
jgi:hypothetical protein